MSTFVLVPGFWLGGWAWDKVAEVLRADGHTVHAVTLTGLGDKAHLATPETDLDTHIHDIVHVITGEDLHDVILVGHSGAGGLVTGAADRVPERIARVVYIESGPMAAGTTQMDNYGPEFKAEIERSVAAAGGSLFPLPSFEVLEQGDISLVGLGDEERALMRSRATAQPYGTMTQPLTLTGGGEKLPKTLVACSIPLEQVRAVIASGHPFFAVLSSPEWDFRELPTGHWPMFSVPEATARVLAGV
ncbi:alpha/beta fold hydrolase [Sinosporangium siamense]|uniref:AB hydrolase-1 domain-containing protein n=1 Tax=Sinosporangium siamense TaxID=1367973 RepID=A0A919RPB0_9ACTN|nr:alpha/beta hydrolase [Sinosporangium siamense]GII97432.1 hypothetical protein Ssi02_76630 [Sinosporangium siamense]